VTGTESPIVSRTPTGGGRRAAHPALILMIIAGAQLMVVLDGTIVNIALPTMGHYFDRSQTDMTWALNAYSLAFGGLLLLGGRSGDIFGRRKMFIIGLMLFTFGSLSAGLATSFPLLLAGRVIQGLGGAISSPTALSLIATEFEEGRERTRAVATYAAVSGAGAALGLLLGGVLTRYLSWRWVLFVNVPIGIVLITGAFFYLHESERLKGRVDVLGALLSVGGMVSLVYGFIHAANDGWANGVSYAVFGAAILLLVAFVLFEMHGTSAPLVPMRIFEDGNRVGAYLVMFVVGAAMFGMFYFITFFTQGVLGYNALQTGFAFLPVAVVIGLTAQIVSRVLPRTGPRPLIVCGTGLLTIALLWLSTVTADSSYFGKVLPGMVVLAVAMGMNFVPLTIVAVSKVANTDSGLASALLNVGQQVGGAIGLSVLATVFATSAKNFAGSHIAALLPKVAALPGELPKQVGGLLQKSGKSSLQPDDISKFVSGLPSSEQGPARSFFSGPYHDFAVHVQAHASGSGFFAGAFFAIVAVGVALFLIRVRKSDLPAPPAEDALVG
jgi:EmrB/QacA subfamily drug resistance transporter